MKQHNETKAQLRKDEECIQENMMFHKTMHDTNGNAYVVCPKKINEKTRAMKNVHKTTIRWKHRCWQVSSHQDDPVKVFSSSRNFISHKTNP
jgi:hypothetical protein